MNALKDYVNWKLTHADKTAEAEGYPLTMENCKKNKRMKQLEIYGSSVQEGTPTPDNPVEVQSVGEKSVNLFGGYSETIIGYYTSDGAFDNTSITAKGIKTSRYISLKPNTTYTISGKSKNNQVGYIRVAEFDSDKNFIKRIFNNVVIKNPKVTFTTDSKTNFIAVCYDDGIVFGNDYGDVPSYIIDIQLEEGTTATLYEPYGKYKIPVVQRGINLFSMEKAGLEPQTINGITFTPLDDERIHIKGRAIDTSIVTSCVFYFQTKMPIKQGVYSVTPYAGVGSIIFRVNTLSGSFITNINSASNNNVFTQDGFLDYCSIRILANNTKDWDDIVPIQLTQGKDLKYLPYEPYVEPVTTNIYLDEPLRKIGDYADYIDGKGDKVVRTIKEHIITGTETVLPFSGANPYNFINIGDPGYVIDDICLCNSFAHQSNFSISREGVNTFRVFNSYSNNASRIAFRLYVDGAILNNENKVRPILKNRYQSGNPVIFYYGLSEPLEESITNDLPKLNAKTTIIEVDTSLAPSNAKGKYIKK